MLNRTLLEGQGLFLKSHKALVDKLTDVLSYPLASPSFTMQPMLQETGGQLTVTPLGALTLASGAAVTRSSDPRVYTLDEGVFLPGPSFSKRLGWKPQVPFDLREINDLGATNQEAQLFINSYRNAGGPSWGGWTSVAHLGSLSIDTEAITNLMSLDLRSMYDPSFRPPQMFNEQIRQLEKDATTWGRELRDPEDWMHPAARRMMRFFRGK